MSGFALGFGSVEESFERQEAEAVREFVSENYDAKRGYFHSELQEKLEAWLKERSAGYDAKADSYRTASEYPDRYSTYYASVLGNASHIVVIFRFLHVNRRHALSPDGWASLSSERLAHVDSQSVREARKVPA